MSPILVYHHLFRSILLRYVLFDQIRIDHEQEFYLFLFVQELQKELVAPAEEVVRMFKETGGSLPRDGNFGVDPPLLRADLIESWKKYFAQTNPE